MPRLLVNRFADDTIAQFRAAARIRDEDARRSASSGRAAAAIYLWGYVAEMTLKAAWFSLLGYPKDRRIARPDLLSALDKARTYGIPWTGNLHNLFHWAELLVQHRIALGRGYADANFAVRVVEHSQRIYERWRETLRYKKNKPYSSEVRIVGQSTEWLLSNSLRL